MGITSDKNSQPLEEEKEKEKEKGRSLFGDLPRIIQSCIRMFGEDDPVTLEYKQQLIDITLRRKQRGDNPNHYEEEEQWHAGMVPNLSPKSEKGLEEDSEDDWEEDQTEDSEDGPAEDEDWTDGPALNPEAPKAAFVHHIGAFFQMDGPALNPEAPKAEPDLSPMSKAGGGWVMKVTILIRGDRYTLKNLVVRGPNGKKDKIRSTMARVYQATWRPCLGYPQAYVGTRLAEAEGGTVEVVHEKEDDDADDGDPTRIMIYH